MIKRITFLGVSLAALVSCESGRELTMDEEFGNFGATKRSGADPEP